MLRLLLIAAGALAGLAAQDGAAPDARRFGPDSPDRGLPRDPAAFAPYDADPLHPWNRVFRLAWLVELVPKEVAATLPREGPAAFASKWVHGKRDGAEADRRWFGGDGRQLPIDELGDRAAAELRSLLADVTRDAASDRERARRAAAPALAVMFQHDLLRIAQRLHDVEHRVELAHDAWRAALATALDAEQLAAIPDTLAPALASGGAMAPFAAELPAQVGGALAGCREVLRRSTRLFDAERTLLWSRVWLRHPDGDAALTAILPGPKDGKPNVPVGFAAALVQGIVAFDRDGVPHATQLVVDVRTQRLANRDPLGADNPTFTRDGIEFGILQLEREGVRRGDAARWFRVVEPDDQDLFRDYGTSKHTTYRGQCTLCHRIADTPEPELGGFVVLRPHAEPRFAATGDERLRLAEQQAAKLAAQLAAR